MDAISLNVDNSELCNGTALINNWRGYSNGGSGGRIPKVTVSAFLEGNKSRVMDPGIETFN